MANAQGNVVTLSYVAEVTPGTTPAAALTRLPVKSHNLNANVTTTTSQEIRSDRATADLVRTGASSSGDVAFELSFTDYEPFIESALGGTFSTAVALTATDISASSVDNSFNSVAAAFSTANILPGMWIKTKGFATAANNGISKVVSVTTAKIVVSHKTLVTEAAGASVTLNSKSVRNGATKKSFTLETNFTDLTTTFAAFRGMLVNTLTLNAASGSIIDGSMAFMGRDTTYGTATVGTGAEVIPAATPIMSAAANVGSIFVDGTALTTTYFKNINLSTTNNLRNLEAISNLYPIDINMGSFGASFSISAFFNGSAEIAKFLAGTSMSLAYSFTDSAGNVIVIDAPYAKYNAATTSGIQLNSDVLQDLNLTALLSPTLNYMFQVSVLAA